MPEKLTKAARSRLMSKVRGKNTRPELVVRSALFALGYRFRLHKKSLAGSPDIVLPAYRTCIFVHGCYWHRHAGCARSSMPATNVSFWEEKFRRTKVRDRAVLRVLRKMGWKTVVIWECHTKSGPRLKKLLSGRMKNIARKSL